MTFAARISLAGFAAFLVVAGGAILAVSAGAAAAAEVKRPLGVVELFTSQGCSSCPPADAALIDLAERGDVIALSFHVDYWDYLGWRDTLASPANTQRQQGYARAFGAQTVYTPQAVINGRTHMSGAKKEEIAESIDRMGGTVDGMRVDVSADWSGESILIDIGNGFTAHQKAHVLVVYFDAESRVAVERGQNRGKSMVYRNSVTSLQSVGMWHGRATRLEVPLGDVRRAGAGGCAVLLQKVSRDGQPGPILGATLLPIPAS